MGHIVENVSHLAQKEDLFESYRSSFFFFIYIDVCGRCDPDSLTVEHVL